ncbi:MAG: hypothetical protein IJ640_06270 [Prevotella sp.]|nr:hypothetical protein [Prevotella sp.]
MKQQVRCSEEEMKALSDVVPVRVLRDNKLLTSYVKEHNLSNMELAQILTYTALRFPAFRLIDIAPDKDITFGELYEYYERARLNFIIIHRVNFLVHQAMIAVYDLLEKDKRLRFGVKKHSKDAEKAWKAYEEPRRKELAPNTWFALQDHFVVMEDMLSPRIEKVYATLRDHMIQGGVQDIEVKGRIELAFLMVKCARHSFKGFMKEFKDASGADFTKCFEAYDMTTMAKSFVRMVEALGIKVETDKFGLYDIAGIGIDKSLRVTWAWDDFIKDVRNEELMDEAATKAFKYNPTVEEEYRKTLEADQQKELEKGLEKLGEKFKVTKQK